MGRKGVFIFENLSEEEGEMTFVLELEKKSRIGLKTF